jgi:hypothetical protein
VSCEAGKIFGEVNRTRGGAEPWGEGSSAYWGRGSRAHGQVEDYFGRLLWTE